MLFQWSYGVTLWEVLTFAEIPYPGIGNSQILAYLKEGERMPKPNDCPQEL
jgi:hypothetical protein